MKDKGTVSGGHLKPSPCVLVGGVVAVKAGVVTAAAKEAAKLAPLASTLSNIDPNKLNHIFNKAEHNLVPLVQKFGGNTTNAYIAVQNAAQKVVNSQSLNGVFDSVKNPITVNVKGVIINVGGNVVDGILLRQKINTLKGVFIF